MVENELLTEEDSEFLNLIEKEFGDKKDRSDEILTNKEENEIKELLDNKEDKSLTSDKEISLVKENDLTNLLQPLVIKDKGEDNINISDIIPKKVVEVKSFDEKENITVESFSEGEFKSLSSIIYRRIELCELGNLNRNMYLYNIERGKIVDTFIHSFSVIESVKNLVEGEITKKKLNKLLRDLDEVFKELYELNEKNKMPFINQTIINFKIQHIITKNFIKINNLFDLIGVLTNRVNVVSINKNSGIRMDTQEGKSVVNAIQKELGNE